jgi:hypothetical protein
VPAPAAAAGEDHVGVAAAAAGVNAGQVGRRGENRAESARSGLGTGGRRQLPMPPRPPALAAGQRQRRRRANNPPPPPSHLASPQPNTNYSLQKTDGPFFHAIILEILASIICA